MERGSILARLHVDPPQVPSFILGARSQPHQLLSGGWSPPHRQRSRSPLGLVRQSRSQLPRNPPDPTRPICHRLGLPPPDGGGDGLDPRLPVRTALADVAGRRPLCLSPTADIAAAPPVTWMPFRLARVSRPVPPGIDALSVTELLQAMRQDDRSGSATSAGSMTVLPGTMPCSVPASSSSSETPRRRHVGHDRKGRRG